MKMKNLINEKSTKKKNENETENRSLFRINYRNITFCFIQASNEQNSRNKEKKKKITKFFSSISIPSYALFLHRIFFQFFGKKITSVCFPN